MTAEVHPVAVYHWWSHPSEPPPYKNLRTPVVLSVATLRAVSTMPILVIDTSGRVNDWAHFPAKLNFTVLSGTPALNGYRELVPGWQYLSRIYDVNACAAESRLSFDTVMYSDSDVFWLRNPLPFRRDPEKFVFDGWNTGFYYYRPYTDGSKLWFDVFDALTRAAVHSYALRKVMRQHAGYTDWYEVWDEMVLGFMQSEHPEFFNLTTYHEHLRAAHLAEPLAEEAKMFHANGVMVPNPVGRSQHARGLLAMWVREFYEKVRLVLDQTDLDMIFSAAEQEVCLSRQFGLFEGRDRLLATATPDGLYHADRII